MFTSIREPEPPAAPSARRHVLLWPKISSPVATIRSECNISEPTDSRFDSNNSTELNEQAGIRSTRR